LANLYMHYAFDRWMDREHPDCPFERYADDIVAHCDSEEQAHNLRAAIAERLETLGLELHPEKTKIVFCKGVPATRLIKPAAMAAVGQPMARALYAVDHESNMQRAAGVARVRLHTAA
jgi:hypothetical protein